MNLYPQSEAYWRASKAWYEQRRAAQSKSKGLRVQVDIRAQEARWTTKGAHYLRNRPGLMRDRWMERDGRELSAEVLRLIAEIVPEVVQGMDQVLGPAALDVWKKWPVSSGLSKSLLRLSYRAEGEALVGELASMAPYTTFIRGTPHLAILRARMDTSGGADRVLADVLERMKAGTVRG